MQGTRRWYLSLLRLLPSVGEGERCNIDEINVFNGTDSFVCEIDELTCVLGSDVSVRNISLLQIQNEGEPRRLCFRPQAVVSTM
jgi:hypothetical protein